MLNRRCNRCQKLQITRKVDDQSNAWCFSLLQSEGISFDLDQNCYLCNKCWLHSIKQKRKAEMEVKKQKLNNIEDIDEEDDALTIENIIFAGSGHKKCIICRCEVRGGSIVMPKSARLDLLILKRLYAPHGVRICKQHLENNHLLNDLEINLEHRQTSIANLKSSFLFPLINDLLTLSQKASSTTRLDFLNNCLTDEDYLVWTGWTKPQFEDMFHLISPHIRTSFNRTAKNTLAIFWIKLKTNLSFKQIASLLNIPGNSEHRRKVAARTFHSVRKILVDILVPKYLGIGHLSRIEAIRHNTSFSNEFFGENVTILWDGTYFYTGKSKSYQFQRLTYSGQKKRHLVKFMSLCLPNGYCLDTLGPFYGNENDSTIAKHITKTNQQLDKWCHYGDIMILDRGFKDVLQGFTHLGYEPKMRIYLPKGQKQFTTKEANEARLVTKVRWTVESYHARLKKWKFFSSRIENQFLPKLQNCVRIVSAALNCYRGSIIKDHQSHHMDYLAKLMKDRLNQNNLLAELIQTRILNKQPNWKRIDQIDLHFPQMTLQNLRQLFFGSYQIKQCQSYAEEHLDVNGDFSFQVFKEKDDLICCAIQSRQNNSTKYYLWIQFSFTGDCPISWYCQCKSGARTIGTCAHVATVIWYLSYARHQHFQSSNTRTIIQQSIELITSESEEDD